MEDRAAARVGEAGLHVTARKHAEVYQVGESKTVWCEVNCSILEKRKPSLNVHSNTVGLSDGGHQLQSSGRFEEAGRKRWNSRGQQRGS